MHVETAVEGSRQEVAALLKVKVHAGKTVAERSRVHLGQVGEPQAVVKSLAQVLTDNHLVSAQATRGKQLWYALP